MEEMGEGWPAAAAARARAEMSTSERTTGKYAPTQDGEVVEEGPRFEFRKKAQYAWKVVLLLITFVALIPILLYQNETGARIYLGFLIGVHVLGLVIFAYGVTKEDIAPSMRGFWMRLLGLVGVAGLLYWASKGLQHEMSSALFWWSLFLLWAIHTAGLALLHIRGRREKLCPFV